jgi:hypothetical protein
MKKKINFEYIYADYSYRRNIPFAYNGETYRDCVDTCIVWNSIDFYGVPFELSDSQLDNIDDCDYTNAVKIGNLFGCLILCKQIIKEGENPLIVCDDSDSDLEYTISALSDDDGPLNPETGNPEQDVFYIHELQMENGYDINPLKSRIIEELPTLILSLLHVSPDILAYYPSPLEYMPAPIQEERKEILRSIAAKKMDTVAEKIAGKKQAKHQENVVNFSDIYQFTDDELNFVMGRRYSGSSYPGEAKNKEEFEFFEANGFFEMGNSRLLYKCIE